MQSKMVEIGLGPLQKMIDIQLKDKPKTKEQLPLNKYLFSCECLCVCVNVDACRPWTCLEPASVRRDVRSPGARLCVTVSCHVIWKTKLSPPQENKCLTSESPLQQENSCCFVITNTQVRTIV